MSRIFSFLIALLPVAGMAQTASWTAISPAAFPTNVSGQIHGISRCSQMKFHPTSATKMYAVSARGGLFISNNAGANWTVTPGTDFMPAMRFASVCVDFVNDSILYLGTGDHNYYYTGNGVYKSTNGGQTFTQSGLTGRLVAEMVMDPLDRNTIVAVTDAGIFKTTNGGTSWTLKSPARPFDDLKLKAANSRTLYATTNDSAFFRSTNFGETWTQITSGITLPAGITNGNGCRVAVTPADTNVVYLGMVANGGLLYKSTNGGTTFTAVKTAASPYLTYYENLSTSSGQGDYNFSIGVDRVNANTVYMVSHCNWKSTDGGTTWTLQTNWWEKCHTDMHQIVTSPYNNNNLYNVNDGGIFLSTDGGNNWTPRSDGMYGYEIYHGNCSPTRRDMISIGTQDNGELYSTTTGWFTNRGGDWSSQCAFDYRSNSSMVYYFDNNKRRLVTGSDATYNLPVTSLQDIAFHRSNSNLAFAANNNIYRTTNLSASAPTWTQISTFATPIKAVHVAFGDPNRVYVITNDTKMYVSANALSASPTWTMYTLPNATTNTASITTVKNNPQIVYITANTGVFRSADGGATWTNIRYNLPSVNHVRILADEYFSGNELVLIASGSAVYYKTASATSWSIYSDFLPSRTEIMDLSIFNDSTANTILRVATYGRGMWESPINNLRSLTANFTADNLNPCPGQAVTFTDLSTGTITSRNWSFPGGTPATSTAANPVVTYSGTGTYNVTLTVSNSGGSSTSTQTAFINSNAAPLPLNEGFEGSIDPPAGWQNVTTATNGFLWTKTATASGFGTSTNSMMFDNYSLNAPGQRNDLIARRVSLSGYNSARLTFDLAYQVFTGFADTLRVLVSTDCGNTYTPVYTKAGSTLSTAGSSGNSFVPTSSQWRKDTINLTSFTGNNDVFVMFRNTNGYGNKLYLDNINLTATVAAVAGTNQTICAGTSVAIGMPPVAGVNYSWTPSAGLSNAAIANPTANPSVTTTYYLTATHAISGISKTDSVKITVNQPPVTNAGSYNQQCTNGTPITLTGSPAGGTFSGPGVTGNSFNPATAGAAGTKTITYTVVSGVCTTSAQANIIVAQAPTVNAGTYPQQCSNGSPITLSGTPAGGVFSGNGVTGTTFNPAAATIGNNTITYTASSNGCPASGQTTLAVIAAPTANPGTYGPLCSNATAISLAGTPAGGTFSGAGVTGNTFNPASAAIGNNTVSYTVTANGCSTTTPTTIIVNQAPTVSAGTYGQQCTNGTPITLTGTPSGGTFSGPGVTGNTFNPSAVGSGTATITYTAVSGNCTSSAQTSIAVIQAPTANAGTYPQQCSNGSPITLSGTPAGGVFSGNGVTGTTFNPAAATIGNNTITYTASSNGCSASGQTTLAVVAAPTATPGTYGPLCSNATAISLAGTPAGGTFSGAGVTGNTFNPASAAIGNNTVSYTVTANGCSTTTPTTIIVNQAPTVSAGTYGQQCTNGTPITLTGTPSGGTFSGPGVTGNTFNPATAGVGNQLITYTVTSNGCTSVAQTVISVGTCCTTIPPKPGTVTQSGVTKVCPGETRTYTVTQQANVTGYVWTAPAGTSIVSGQGTNQLVLSFTNALPATCTLQVNSVNSCGNSSALTSKTITKNSAPSTPSTITGAAAGICGSSNQTYSVTAVNGVSYTWSFSNTAANLTSGQGTNAVQASFQSGYTTGVLSVSATNGCGTSANRNLTINAVPAKAAAITGSATFCPGVGSTYSITPISGATSYTWSAPSGSTILAGGGSGTTTLTTTATSVLVTFGNVAGYVRVKANNACGSSALTSLQVTQNCAAKGSVTASNEPLTHLSLFPNPATTFVQLTITTEATRDGRLNIYDGTGKAVFSKTVRLESVSTSEQVNISGWASGRYQAVLQIGDDRFTTSFVKE